jgi:dihydropyrimidinase
MSDSVTLLRGGRVVSADGEVDADVLIVGEQIAAVGTLPVPDGAEVVDVGGCLLLPGLIDNHTHLSMPFMGMMSSDDYDTGTQAAAAGGVTCLVDFAIQREPDNLTSALEEWQARADGAAHVDYGFHMAITNANAPTIEDMATMVDAGVTSFKLFMAYKGELMTRDDALAATMERARDLGALVMIHAENGDLVDLFVRRTLAAGQTDAIYHALTRPEFVEAEATGRAARIAEHTGASLFVVHVTCQSAAAEIEAAQQRGAKVTGETCTQYLVNTIDDLRKPDGVGQRYICSPPLRDATNQEPLWQYLRRGVLESVSTDHCPFNSEQKARGHHDFSLVPNGLPVIQHRLAKLWDEGVVAGRITPSQLVDLTSTTIDARFGLTGKGAIAPGKDADIAVFDPSAPRAYGVENSFMNVDYDLYEGETASGSVRHTYCRGTLVYDQGEIKTAPGHGRFVERSGISGTSKAGTNHAAAGSAANTGGMVGA